MTRREWARCKDPARMLYHLSDRLSPRKRQLFCCACVRRVWHLVGDDSCRRAVEVAERFADGLASEQELEAADEATAQGGGAPYSDAELAATFAAIAHIDFAGQDAVLRHPAVNAACYAALAAGPGEAAAQADLLRDITGDPPRPVRADPGWLSWEGGTARALAKEASQQRQLPAGTLDPTRLAVLADALEEAGADAGVVAHLRSPGPHWTGCWALDAVLGLS